MSFLFILIWSGFFAIWVIVSTAIHSTLTIIFRPVSYKISYAIMKNWCKLLVVFSGIRLRVEGLEKLDRSEQYMFIVNHASLFDIPVLVIGIPLYTNFIAKRELFSIPIFGWGLRAIGHIPLNRTSARTAVDSTKKAVDQLHKTHRSLILFPEGTRTLTGKVGEFRPASFSLVKDSGIKMVPVFIDGAGKVFNKKAWYLSPGQVSIIIADPIGLETVKVSSKKELMEISHRAIVAMQEKRHG